MTIKCGSVVHHNRSGHLYTVVFYSYTKDTFVVLSCFGFALEITYSELRRHLINNELRIYKP